MARSLYAILAALLASLVAAGCGSSSYVRLASENDIAHLAVLKQEAATRPNRTVMVSGPQKRATFPPNFRIIQPRTPNPKITVAPSITFRR